MVSHCLCVFFQLKEKVYLESYRGNRIEPAGLCRRRKQVTGAEEGPLEFRREKCKGKVPRGKKKGKGKGSP